MRNIIISYTQFTEYNFAELCSLISRACSLIHNQILFIVTEIKPWLTPLQLHAACNDAEPFWNVQLSQYLKKVTPTFLLVQGALQIRIAYWEERNNHVK